jgi:hypothetical protein
MDALARLQQWNRSQCDGGPGWSVDVDLRDTPLAGKAFKEHRYGVGSGGPFKLQELFAVFLDWAEKNN